MTMQPTDREKELGDLLIIGGKKSGKSFELGRQLGRQEVIDEIEKIINEARAKDLKEQFGLNAMVVLSVIRAKLNNLKK